MCSILCYAGKDVTKETMEGYLLKTKMRWTGCPAGR